MSKKTFFITGIGTEIGKTIVSSIFVQALKADYWKPIQAGDLENTDAMKVEKWVDFIGFKTYPNAYSLKYAMSPHAAANRENIKIDVSNINRPKTSSHLVIEGAGGLLVPLNNYDTIFNLIQSNDKIVIVSQNYLGSINHTLLTLDYLKNYSSNILLIFNGIENKESEYIIEKKTGIKSILKIKQEKKWNTELTVKYAEILKSLL